MTILVIIVLVVLVVALYPIVRDFLRRRQAAVPSYVEGLQLLLDGKNKEAIAKLKETVNADTTNVDAYVRLGKAFIEQGDVERGVKIHENLALRRNLKPAEEMKVYRALAADYLRTDRKLRATSILEELTRLVPGDTSCTEKLFRLYLETESWDECRTLLKNLSRRPADRRWTALMLAEYGRARAKDKPELALEQFREALRLDRNCLAARLYQGDCRLARGDTEAAVRSWNEILDLAPDRNFLVRRRLESAYYDLGRYDEIIQAYENLLRKVPGDRELALALARIYQKMQNLPAAVRLLEKAAPDDSDMLSRVTLATLHLQQEATGKAERVLAGLLEQKQSGRYRCAACGEVRQEPSFSCPTCHAWLLPPGAGSSAGTG